MYAVSLSLGATNAYVAVAQLSANATSVTAAPIKVMANSSGHRGTPCVAALTEQEFLFGDNAKHCFARHPHRVVPYVFSFAAAAASMTDAARDESAVEAPAFLLQAVRKAASTKYRGHCALDDNIDMEQHHEPGKRFGFRYDMANGDDVTTAFVSVDDLFIQFLNHIKEHTVDSACGLATSAEGANKDKRRNILLTVVVPRYAFPAAAAGNSAVGRHQATEWLRQAVHASHFDAVVQHVSVLFSDEAALLAMDTVASPVAGSYFLSPSSGHTVETTSSSSPIAEGNVLIVDWGAHALTFSVLHTRGGMLVDTPEKRPSEYLCSVMVSAPETCPLFSSIRSCGGDAVDVALADRVAANYILQQRRTFSSQVPNMACLQQLNHNLTGGARDGEVDAHQVISEVIPSRAMRRLRLLMEEKKIAINTNPQTSSVAVEVEAFYDGMDLLDNLTMSRNKFDAAVRNDWGLVAVFEKVLHEFLGRYAPVCASSAGAINYVVLSGGMCQIPAIAQSLRQVFSTCSSPSLRTCVSPKVKVLDALHVGNGVAADELASVGGCFYSYQLAQLVGMKEKAKRPTKGRQASQSHFQQAIRKENSDIAGTLWEAFSNPKAGMSLSEVKNTSALMAEANYSALLKNSLYVYTGSSIASLGSDTSEFVLPRESLALLFAKQSPLPSRVVIAWPDESTATVVLYLFAEVDSEALEGELRVQPVVSSGVTLAHPKTESDSSVFIVLTVQLKPWCDETRVTLTAHVVAAGPDSRGPPTILTPGNIQSKVEIPLL